LAFTVLQFLQRAGILALAPPANGTPTPNTSTTASITELK
jgi:hypothetical protein